MKTKEEVFKDMDLDKLHRFDYCPIKLKCGDCPFYVYDQYNNKQPCKDSIKEYVEKKKKMKEILR